MAQRVGILGATGLVGRELIRILEERALEVAELRLLASPRSAGTRLPFRGVQHEVREVSTQALDGLDLLLASAGGDVSRRWLPEAGRLGVVSVDNTSAFRMEPDVPLVVPEVNAHRLAELGERRIVANPNCSTIQLVLALKPLLDLYGLRRVIVSSYQAISGAGAQALATLEADTRRLLAEEPRERLRPVPVAFNAVPQIDLLLDDGSTREEWKLRVETPKILEAEVAVHATCVRVPVRRGHSEAVWVETERPVDLEEARAAWRAFPGVELRDDPSEGWPTALDVAHRDPVLIGRVRSDPTVANGLAFWVVADNLRKGAALNAVQVAEALIACWPS